MPKVHNFSENLESSLVRLGGEVSKKMESPEWKNLSEREVVKQSIQSLAGGEEEPLANGSATAPAPISVPADDFMPGYLSGGSEDVKKIVENLLQVAVSEDIVKAVRGARKYPPFIEDAFHDALVDKFLPELKKRGIIK